MERPAVIGRLNLFPRGWGGSFRTAIAANNFVAMDRSVAWRLERLLIKRRGRNLRAGQADQWTRIWFHDQGLHKLMSTICSPKAASPCSDTPSVSCMRENRTYRSKGMGNRAVMAPRP
jgi:hypothetical protein